MAIAPFPASSSTLVAPIAQPGDVGGQDDLALERLRVLRREQPLHLPGGGVARHLHQARALVPGVADPDRGREGTARATQLELHLPAVAEHGEAQLLELAGDVLGGDLRAARSGVPPLQEVGGEEVHVRLHLLRGDLPDENLRRGRDRRGGGPGQGAEAQGEKLLGSTHVITSFRWGWELESEAEPPLASARIVVSGGGASGEDESDEQARTPPPWREATTGREAYLLRAVRREGGTAVA